VLGGARRDRHRIDLAEQLAVVGERRGADLGCHRGAARGVAIALRLVTAPRFIEVHRLSAFPDRSLDIDVVFDLMIHDLDVILSLVQSEPSRVSAVGVPVLTDDVDIANARVEFANGAVANVTASRVSTSAQRRFRVVQANQYV
jgi:predicted dehydrogenase